MTYSQQIIRKAIDAACAPDALSPKDGQEFFDYLKRTMGDEDYQRLIELDLHQILSGIQLQDLLRVANIGGLAPHGDPKASA